MQRSSAAYASAELMKVLPEPGSIRSGARTISRSICSSVGGCPAHAGRVRPAAFSICLNLRPAWSLHHSMRPSSVRVASYVIGRLVTVLAREKDRRIEKGVEGVVLSLLDPSTLREIIEYWAPIAEF